MCNVPSVAGHAAQPRLPKTHAAHVQVLAASSYAALLAEAWDALPADAQQDAGDAEAASTLLRAAQDLCAYQAPVGGQSLPCSGAAMSAGRPVRSVWSGSCCITQWYMENGSHVICRQWQEEEMEVRGTRGMRAPLDRPPGRVPDDSQVRCALP